MNKKIIFSIIIPVRKENRFLAETKHKLSRQTYKNFELIVITDQLANSKHLKNYGPSYKRNFGAQIAKGKYLAFLDDDSYPDQNWLENIYQLFIHYKSISAVCGPTQTPPHASIKESASGLVVSSLLGSGGAGLYRNLPQNTRFVDDYPTVNLIVKKSDFKKVGGFNTNYWPGEDTLFCLSLQKNFGPKSILYHPSVLVYHHRRKIGIDFLKQHSRYGLHRGFFAKKFPENSLKISYFLPSLFSIYLLLAILNLVPKLPIYTYFFLLLTQLIYFVISKNNIYSSLLATLFIPLNHLVYGIFFIKGLLSKNITFSPHKINSITGEYQGG